MLANGLNVKCEEKELKMVLSSKANLKLDQQKPVRALYCLDRKRTGLGNTT